MPNKKKDYQIWTDQNTWADVFARFNKKKQKKNHSNKYILIAIFVALVGLIVILDSGIKLKEVHFERTIKEVELHNLNLKMNERLKMGVREEIIHLANNSNLARITCYSWTGNPMANTLYPVEGYVATSDRTIPFGTKIIIEGIEYEVGDRTAKWVHEDFEYQTIDIYKDNCSMEFGAEIKSVIIK